jgi:hypothetical protein
MSMKKIALIATSALFCGPAWAETTGIAGAGGGGGGAVTQSGIWTVQPGNTPNTTPWLFRHSDGTNLTPIGDAAARPIFMRITDGTNTMPTMDVAFRPGFVKVTDGTNTMPSMDTAARSGFFRLTDATNTAAVKAASTAAAAADPSLVTNESTNSEPTRGIGATSSTVPAKAAYLGVNCSGVLCGMVQGTSLGFLTMSAATTTEIVALTGGQAIYVTGWDVLTNGTTNVKFVRGTGTNCGTGTTDISPNYPLVASLPYGRGGGLGLVFSVTAGNALCVVNSAAVTTAISVTYSKAP